MREVGQTMEELQPEDRPREKLERLGVHGLGDNELLAVLLGHGSAGRDALVVANDILGRAEGIHGLLRWRQGQLRSQPGVGRVQAARILAAIELGRRTLSRQPVPRPQFRSPREVAEYLLPRFGASIVEQFGILLLDTRLRLLGCRLVSVGSMDGAPAQPRDVFREALAGGARVIAAFHNHPSGDPTPSQADVRLTMRLRDAGAIVGVEVVDHVILTETRYYSLREQGLI